MRSRQRNILSRIKEAIHSVEPDAEIILFGSVARGDASPTSDIDLLIIVDKPYLSRRERDKIAFPLIDLEIDEGVLIGPIVRTRDEWENPPFRTPFMVNVAREGVKI